MCVEWAAGIKEDADTRKAARIFQEGWGRERQTLSQSFLISSRSPSQVIFPLSVRRNRLIESMVDGII